MGKDKLSRDTWIAAGFLSLATGGPAALQINLLARELGATKGSFYWHFKDLAEYKEAMLDLWREKAAKDIISDLRMAGSPEERLDGLIANAAEAAPDAYGGRKIEPAMRAWALLDADVASALAELDELRLTFLRGLMTELGLENPALAELFYGAYIGLDDLAAKGRADTAAALEALKALMLERA